MLQFFQHWTNVQLFHYARHIENTLNALVITFRKKKSALVLYDLWKHGNLTKKNKKFWFWLIQSITTLLMKISINQFSNYILMPWFRKRRKCNDDWQNISCSCDDISYLTDEWDSYLKDSLVRIAHILKNLPKFK